MRQSLKRNVPLYWTVISPTIAFVLLLIMMILYIDYSNRHNDERWCKLMSSLDDRQQQIKNDPKVSADQREFIDNIHELRQSLGCKSHN
jgi:hypothetical protein